MNETVTIEPGEEGTHDLSLTLYVNDKELAELALWLRRRGFPEGDALVDYMTSKASR